MAMNISRLENEKARRKFGSVVAEFRKDTGLTTREFGELIGLSGGYITQIEKGQKVLSKGMLFKLLFYFNEVRKGEFFKLPEKHLINLYCVDKNSEPDDIMNEYVSFTHFQEIPDKTFKTESPVETLDLLLILNDFDKVKLKYKNVTLSANERQVINSIIDNLLDLRSDKS